MERNDKLNDELISLSEEMKTAICELVLRYGEEKEDCFSIDFDDEMLPCIDWDGDGNGNELAETPYADVHEIHVFKDQMGVFFASVCGRYDIGTAKSFEMSPYDVSEIFHKLTCLLNEE